MININSLTKSYTNDVKSNILTDSQRITQKNDHDALRELSKSKRLQREARQESRMVRNISTPKKVELELKKIDENPTMGLDVKRIEQRLKDTTNALAREYNLPEPNNPEALAHDRLHCTTCDRLLDSPNAHKTNNFDNLFEDSEIRIMCCWCFGKMGDDDIKSTMKTDKVATKEIRLKIYNPVESTKAEIESLVGLKKIQLKSKLKKWEQDVSLVGNIKHCNITEGNETFENNTSYYSKGIHACTL